MLALALAACATRAAALELEVAPVDPEGGATIRVLLRALPPGATAACALDGRPLPLYAFEGGLRALAGLPANVQRSTSPLSVSVRTAGAEEGRDSVLRIREKPVALQNLEMPAEKRNLITDPGNPAARARIHRALTAETAVQLWRGRFRMPAQGRVSALYGVRRILGGKDAWDWHKGIDIAAPKGAAVRAPNDGVVLLTGKFPLQGRAVIIDHGQGVTSLLMHLASVKVKPGRRVRAGDLIGRVGSEGFSTGPHVHWGVYVHAVPVNPAGWLEREN